MFPTVQNKVSLFLTHKEWKRWYGWFKLCYREVSWIFIDAFKPHDLRSEFVRSLGRFAEKELISLGHASKLPTSAYTFVHANQVPAVQRYEIVTDPTKLTNHSLLPKASAMTDDAMTISHPRKGLSTTSAVLQHAWHTNVSTELFSVPSLSGGSSHEHIIRRQYKHVTLNGRQPGSKTL